MRLWKETVVVEGKINIYIKVLVFRVLVDVGVERKRFLDRVFNKRRGVRGG